MFPVFMTQQWALEPALLGRRSEAWKLGGARRVAPICNTREPFRVIDGPADERSSWLLLDLESARVIDRDTAFRSSSRWRES